MTTPAIGATTMHPTVPFMTTSMFRAEPTGLTVDNMVAGGTPQQQEAELARIIKRASQEMNSFCYGKTGGTLNATADTEVMRTRIHRDGRFVISPRFTPVMALNSFSWGDDIANMTALNNLAHVEVEQSRIRIPAYPFTGMSSAGPLQFGAIGITNYDLLVQFTYINGWPLTSLTATVAQGAQTLTVADATGIYANRTVLTIRDPLGGDESFIPTAVNGTTLTVPPLQYAHTVGTGTAGVIQVDGCPDDFVSACTEITSGFLKRKRAETVSKPKNEPVDSSPGEENFARGFEILHDYEQVRAR